MNKKLENISLGLATLFVLAIIGLIGFGFFYVVMDKIMAIGLVTIISMVIIAVVGIISLMVSLICLYVIGDAVNKNISRG